MAISVGTRCSGALVERTPGIRMPGAADGFELAVRAIVGQQISVAAARTVAGRLVRGAGRPLHSPALPVTHTFPSPEAVASLAYSRPDAFSMPASRRKTIAALAEALAEGDLSIDSGADPQAVRTGLLALPGIGPWTAGYVAMRALGDPDGFLPTDLGVRHALEGLGCAGDPRSAGELAERWRPWRAYAVAHLWNSLAAKGPRRRGRRRAQPRDVTWRSPRGDPDRLPPEPPDRPRSRDVGRPMASRACRLRRAGRGAPTWLSAARASPPGGGGGHGLR